MREREKARNWLVEGVAAQEKSASLEGKRNHPTEAAETMAAQDPEGHITSADESGVTDPFEALVARPEPLREDGSDPVASAGNPLAPFLSSWMRSGDFELLAAGQARGVNAHADLGATPSRDSLVSIAAESGSSTLAPGVVPPDHIVNPYLQNVQTEFASLTPAGQVVVTAPVLVPAVSTESQGAVTAPPASPLPGLSEKLRARDDARYFKQLKRF